MWLLQQGYNIDVSGPGPFQWAVTIMVMLGLFALITGLLYYSRYAGLPSDRAKTKARLFRERHAASPEIVRIPAEADRMTIRERVQEAAQRARNPDDVDGVRFRDVVAAVREAIGEAWAPVLGRIPKWSRRVAEYGIVLAIAGAVALEEAAIVDAVEGGVGTLTVGTVVTELLVATETVVRTSVDVATAFPYLDMVWALTLTVFITGMQWLYAHWYLTGPTIVAGAVVVAYAEWRLGDDVSVLHETDLVQSQWSGALSVSWAIISVWLAGIVPTMLGGVVGVLSIPGVGSIDVAGIAAGLGLLLALVQLGRVVRSGGTWFADRVRDIASMPADGASRLAATWVVVRHVWTVLVLATAPILVVYLVVIAVEGNAVSVLAALLGASPEIKALLVLAVGLPLYAVARRLRANATGTRDAVRAVFARQAYRAKVFQQGIPFLLVAIGYIIGFGFTGSIVLGALVGIVIGIVARQVYGKLIDLRHRADWFERDIRPKASTVEVYPPLSDGDGIVHVARASGDWLLEDSVAGLSSDVATAIDDGETTVAHWRAKAAFGSGIVKAENAIRKVRERARKELFDQLRPVGSVSTTDDVDEAVEEVPPAIVDAVREDHTDTIVERDGYCWLQYDPYEKGDRRRSSVG